MYTKVEAAYLILKKYKKPLHVREIIRIALSGKMIETKGKTPWSTMGADFYNENKRRTRQGRDLRFVSIGEGVWGLTEWGLTPAQIEAAKPKGKVKKSKSK